MNRDKALAVLHQISVALRESVLVSGVSLDDASLIVGREISQGFSIRMSCVFDEQSWERIKPILKNNGLKMKVADKYVILY